MSTAAAGPKFDRSAWSPAKISDVTGGGPYLFVTSDRSRSGNAASNCGGWAAASTAVRKPSPLDLTSTATTADARRELNKTQGLLKEGKDPSTEKQFDKHRQAAAYCRDHCQRTRSREKWRLNI